MEAETGQPSLQRLFRSTLPSPGIPGLDVIRALHQVRYISISLHFSCLKSLNLSFTLFDVKFYYFMFILTELILLSMHGYLF